MSISKFTAAAAAIVITGTTFAATPSSHFKHSKTLFATEKKANDNGSKVRRVQLRNQAPSIWCPQHEEVSVWMDEWVLSESDDIVYTKDGLEAIRLIFDVEDEHWTRTSNSYDDNGMATYKLIESSDDGETFTDYTKTEIEYDSRITDYITSNKAWLWISGWQQIGNNYIRTITRDSAGNITGVETAVLFQGVFDPTIRVSIEYGDDGKATSITQSDLVYDYNTDSYSWEVSKVMSDIVWDRTDGQITDTENLTSGNNRILSAHLVNSTDDVDITAEYTADGYVLTRTGLIQGMEATATVTYSYSGNKEHLQEKFEMDEDGEIYTEIYDDIAEYDSFGYITLITNTSTFDGETYLDNLMEGTLTYDETYGYPLTYTTKLADFDEDDEIVMVPEMHIVFSDYVDVANAAVDAVIADSDAKPVYYNLHGMRVDAGNLTPGIYVVRQGDRTFKQIVR